MVAKDQGGGLEVPPKAPGRTILVSKNVFFLYSSTHDFPTHVSLLLVYFTSQCFMSFSIANIALTTDNRPHFPPIKESWLLFYQICNPSISIF